MSTGKHPYNGFNNFAQMNAIMYNEVPKLEFPKYSLEFCEFIELWFDNFFNLNIFKRN